MERYLRENPAEVRASLALGQGGFVEDMSSAMGLTGTQPAALGRLLRRERGVLAALAEPERLTPGRAGQFFEHVRVSMASDRVLAPALVRVDSNR